MTESRPTPAVIKLVESCGILLGIPPSNDRSAYKAPLPSNYDATIGVLNSNFGGYVSELSKLTSDQLSNKVANDLYAKSVPQNIISPKNNIVLLQSSNP